MGAPDNSHNGSGSANDGNQQRWKEITKKWKTFQKLIEQVQQETALYKQAEKRLEQQFDKLKTVESEKLLYRLFPIWIQKHEMT
jgi:molecular chaperone GrpE (heat shock protein)